MGNETQKEAYNPNLVPVIEEDFCDEMGFEERVGTIHDKFNHTLNYLLREIKNQEQEHFTGSILHILNRFDIIFPHFFLRKFLFSGWISMSFIRKCTKRRVSQQKRWSRM